MSTVYVVSFAGATEADGGGGFFWYPETARAAAECQYITTVRESARYGGENVVRLVEVDVPPTDGDDRAAGITEWIDYMALDGIETYYPALRQYVPPKVEIDRIPTGGIYRPTPRSKS